MLLNYLQTILPPGEQPAKVSCLAWAPNNAKLAAAAADKVVHLFDEAGERRDKFKTKPGDGGGSAGGYVVRSMAFSPDSTKLAVAQSDSIVFVYRLGADWGPDSKKSICNKFAAPAPVTCLAWPPGRPGELVYGLADGSVKLGVLKSNKAYAMYAHPAGSFAAALAASASGGAIASAHADGSVWRFAFPDAADGQAGGAGRLLSHACTPAALAWGEASLLVAGGDSRVVFYDSSGRQQQVFDYSSDDEARDFASAAFNPAGDAAVVGAFNRLYVFSYSSSRGAWEQAAIKQIDNFATATCLCWKPDGSRLAVGGLTGALDLYDACVKRIRHKGKFEFSYVSASAVIVKTLATGRRTALKSVYGSAISRLCVYQERFLVGRTPASLLLGDLEGGGLSELPWEGDGGERFYFEGDKVCLVFRAGELTVIEYGSHEPLAACRTEQFSPYLLSVAAVEARGACSAARRLAFLVDLQTLRVLDLLVPGGAVLATISHDTRIDWLEMNVSGSHLLFRDKRRQLHLYDIGAQARTCLLSFCEYVQWVPRSSVVVAQSRAKLCVWYSAKHPDRMTSVAIKGDVEGIVRRPGATEVLVAEGLGSSAYALDELLVDFGAALEDLDLARALATLEPLELKPETEAQWAALGALALQQEALGVAERCAAALGDVAKARYLRKLLKEAAAAAPPSSAASQAQQPLPVGVRAQLAVLAKQWPVAEALLLAQGRVEELLAAYQAAHRWDDVVRVADTSRHASASELRSARQQWLLASGQEAKAAALLEGEGQHLAAISMYLKAGLPARAAQVIIAHGGAYDASLLSSIVSALTKAGLHERCGELQQHLGRQDEALACFRKGHAYRQAVELARVLSPASVISLEEEWGDWLAGLKQHDAAVNHFIEAGATLKAIEAAISAQQFTKAAGIVDFLEPSKAQPFFKRIAQHYEAAGNRAEAERYLLRAGEPLEAVEMWIRAGNWDAGHKVARGYLTPEQLHAFCSKHGRAAEAAGAWADAERAYVACGEVDMAVSMHRRNKAWLSMLKLVQAHRREQLPQAHMLVAQALQAEGAWREAERHFCEAQQWKAAVGMYQQQGAWEDGLRVAKVFGGAAAMTQVAYAWAVSISQDEAGVLLRRLGLGEAVVDAAAEGGDWGHAFSLAQAAAPGRLPEVHLKYAMHLEDSGRFGEAEAEFVAAGKPREAIDMHLHNQDWGAALAVAESYDPTAVMDVLAAQASAAAAAEQYELAESLYLKAKRPEGVLAMYRHAGHWQDALRIAEAYLPGKLQELHLEMASSMPAAGTGGTQAAAARGHAYEQGHDYARAIDAYLSVGPADSSDLGALQQCWEQAARVAMQHQRHRVQEVVAAVVQRLASIGRVAAAAELQESAGDVQGAIATLCRGGMFDRARQLAGGNPGLLSLIDEQHTQHLVASNDAEQLAVHGKTAAALEMYAAQGNWARAHELAVQSGPEMAASCAARHASLLVRQQDWAAAAAVLAAHGVAANTAHFALYREVALEVLGASMQQRQPQAEADAREYLYRLSLQLDAAGTSQVRQQDADDFRTLLWACHYTALAAKAAGAGLLGLAARQLTARLRYAGVVPADRAFFEAGMAWRAAGVASMAFVVLNRFLDVADAMEDPSAAGGLAQLEAGDWAGTDVPADPGLPQQAFASEAAREEARNYVLEVSMDARVSQALASRHCPACGADVYEACLVCGACGAASEACAVSGYPVPAGERVVPRSGLVARRADWNEWVGAFGTDPVSGGQAAPLY